TCWLDTHDIAGGANWGGSIAGAIEQCAALILMSSAASLASRNVRQEIALAWRHDKPCVPLLLDTSPAPNDIAYWLATAQWIDVLDHSVDAWLPRVMHALSTPATTGDAAMPAATQSTARPAPPTSLPSPASSLIGREREMAEVAALFHRGRVVTLTGPGGIGKTRLAIAAGHRLEREYTDGAVFVDLAPLHDPALVLPALAATFGMQDTGARPVLDILTDALHDRQVLVIVDNVEQVIDAAADLSHLVVRCPELTLLATSREPLRIGGEVEYPVAPLPLPDTSRAIDHARLGETPAVALFVERAGAVRSGFAVTEENAETIVAICRQLDGMPLAVELAAARVRSLPLPNLLERLKQPLRFLTGGARDLPARQQTIRDTIQWSYDLLTPDEQSMFRRLAVFVGGWTLDTAEAVVDIDGDLGIDVLDGLISLVEKSLVVQREQLDGTLRYRLLVPIREFASEQLEQHGETASLRQRHAEAMRDFVRQDFDYPREFEYDWLERVNGEYDNIRAALAWASDQRVDDLGIAIAGTLGWFWFINGYHRDGLDWTQAFLARHIEQDALRARALNGLALLSRDWGDHAAAEQAADDSVTIGMELGDVALVAEALMLRAYALMYAQNSDSDAIQITCAEALGLAEEHRFEFLANNVLFPWAIQDILAGRYERAEDSLDRAREIAVRHGWTAQHTSTWWGLGLTALLRGDVEAAITHSREALLVNRSAIYGFVGFVPLIVTLELLATALLRAGEVDVSARLWAVIARERRLRGITPPDWWRAYLLDLHDLRSRLDPAAFDEAWRAGSAMSLEDGIALALEITEG
ncbi:MAG TPA: TIR domain-containing protein, partial [Thermomicrobiales bacterium]|nr:TIR domain-containing protein [Thermomicrobiales bacterium]